VCTRIDDAHGVSMEKRSDLQEGKFLSYVRGENEFLLRDEGRKIIEALECPAFSWGVEERKHNERTRFI